jgi:hypothetical protein
LLIFQHFFAQTAFQGGNGGVKFSMQDSEKNEYQTEAFHVSFDLIGAKNLKISFDTLLFSGSFISLSPGKYSMRIESTKFCTVKCLGVVVNPEKITFLELPLVNKSMRKRLIRIKYHEPKRYKNCG